MTLFSTLTFVLVFLNISCVRTNKEQNNGEVNFNDTLYEKHTFLSNNGDTMVNEHDTIYFSPTNFNFDTSNFFYEVAPQHRLNQGIYKIFFPRKNVIAFCDSMLNSFPFDPKSEVDDYFNDRLLYNAIKKQASENKMNESVFADELEILLERFHPFILNALTSDTPKYIIIKYEDEGYSEFKSYNIRSKSGDTIFLTGSTIREIEMEKYKGPG